MAYIKGIGIVSAAGPGRDEFRDALESGAMPDGFTVDMKRADKSDLKKLRRADKLSKLSVLAAKGALRDAGQTISEDNTIDAGVILCTALGPHTTTFKFLDDIIEYGDGAVSPTTFSNSVHNAATGYWSIATESHCPANAVSARAYSASMAFLEAAVQAVEENVPVLLVTQEMAAPPLLHHACPSEQPFSAAMLLAPVGYCGSRISSVRFAITATSVDRPELPEDLKANLSSNFGALLLPFLAAIAKASAGGKENATTQFKFPLSEYSSISLSL